MLRAPQPTYIGPSWLVIPLIVLSVCIAVAAIAGYNVMRWLRNEKVLLTILVVLALIGAAVRLGWPRLIPR